RRSNAATAARSALSLHDALPILAEGDEPFGLSESVCAGFVRIVTHRRLWNPPTEIGQALAFVEALRARSICRPLSPGPTNWQIFSDLCCKTKARGKLVPDAHHAAMAIEHGCEW